MTHPPWPPVGRDARLDSAACVRAFVEDDPEALTTVLALTPSRGAS